jgi:hypothetical protein
MISKVELLSRIRFATLYITRDCSFSGVLKEAEIALIPEDPIELLHQACIETSLNPMRAAIVNDEN